MEQHTPTHDLDFTALICYLMKEGMTEKEIADEVGVGEQHIKRIRREYAEVNSLPIDLLRLFLQRTKGIDVPFVGEHHPVVEVYQ